MLTWINVSLWSRSQLKSYFFDFSGAWIVPNMPIWNPFSTRTCHNAHNVTSSSHQTRQVFVPFLLPQRCRGIMTSGWFGRYKDNGCVTYRKHPGTSVCLCFWLIVIRASCSPRTAPPLFRDNLYKNGILRVRIWFVFAVLHLATACILDDTR